MRRGHRNATSNDQSRRFTAGMPTHVRHEYDRKMAQFCEPITAVEQRLAARSIARRARSLDGDALFPRDRVPGSTVIHSRLTGTAWPAPRRWAGIPSGCGKRSA